MKAFNVLLASSAVLFLLGCSSVSVTTDYDREANFASLKTFDWITAAQNVVSPNAQTAMFQNTLIEKHMKRAVASQLDLKGVKQDTSKPDFYVAFHSGTEQKVNVTNYGYGYGYGARWGGGGVDVQQYTQGTLILDFIDAKTKQLVWRGVATGALAENPDPSQAEGRISEVVQRMMQDYPPVPGK